MLPILPTPPLAGRPERQHGPAGTAPQPSLPRGPNKVGPKLTTPRPQHPNRQQVVPFRPASRPPRSTPPIATQPESPTVQSPAAKVVVRTCHVAELAADEKASETLVKVVRGVVRPKSCDADAGVEYLPSVKTLVVRQAEPVHIGVKELLALLEPQKKPAQHNVSKS